MNPTVRRTRLNQVEPKYPFRQGRVWQKNGSGLQSGLDLHKDTGRDDQAVERLDGPGGGLEDVDDALVGAHLELLARLLIDVRTAQHRVALDPRGDRDRPAHAGVGP